MNENLICNPCPCRHEDICIRAGYNNGQEFGDALRRKIAEAKRNNVEGNRRPATTDFQDGDKA